jgi:hypothetical protein
MAMGMFGSLLGVRNHQERRARLTNRTARRGQLFLESLETRTLLSILMTSPPRLTNTGELDLGGLANVSIGKQSEHQGDQHHDHGDSPGDGQQDGPGGKKNVSVATGTDSQVGIQPGQLDTQLSPLNGSQGDKQQGQDGQNSGQDSPGDQGGSQSDGSNGQSSGSQDGSTSGQDNPGDQGGSQSNGSNGQSGSGDGSQGTGQTSAQGGNSGGGAAAGTNAPADTPGSSQDQQSDATKNNQPDSQGNPEKAPLDTGLEQKTSGAPAVPGMGTGENTPPTGPNSGPDRKQHSSSSGSVSDGEQRSPVGAQDGKQHGPSGLVMPDEELHILVSHSSQEPEQSNRNQALAPIQQQNVPMEEPNQRQVEERVTVAAPHQRLVIEEESSQRPAEEIVTSVVSTLLEPTTPGTNHSYVSPKNHGLLTDSLALDFSSLRSEVQSFFELLNNLGGHPTEKQIGVLLSSGAVVVAAAMACEVARRQARRPTPGSPFALVPRLEFASEPDAPSGAGLPNFGQFSAFR